MNDETARKLGFKDKEEFFLYQDVCCTEVPLRDGEFEKILEQEIKNMRLGKHKNKVSKDPKQFKKELYEQYISDNNLEELFDKVKDMTTVDRLIELYIYYSNKLSLCSTARKTYELKMQDAIELFDGVKEEEYEKIINEINIDHKKCNDILDFISYKKNERLTSIEEMIKFNNAVDKVNESYADLLILLDQMDGKQR